jgi:hypothetical protein
MRLAYGSYLHDLAECTVQIGREALTDQAGRHYGDRHRWTVSGFLVADTQAALTTAIEALTRAYQKDFQPVQLQLPDGTVSAHHLPAVSKIGGTKVISGPSFNDGGRAEYTTFRTYEIVLEHEAELPTTPRNLVIAWAETLSFAGGGPRDLFLQPLNGVPQKQRVADATPWKVTQQGSAVGLLAYPVPAPPLWPAAEHRDQRVITNKHPKRVGSKFSEFEVTWGYQFESAAPLNGLPTQWRL